MVLFHPEARYLLMLSVVFGLAIIVVGAKAYKMGIMRGYEEALTEDFLSAEKWRKMYEDLLEANKKPKKRTKNADREKKEIL